MLGAEPDPPGAATPPPRAGALKVVTGTGWRARSVVRSVVTIAPAPFTGAKGVHINFTNFTARARGAAASVSDVVVRGSASDLDTGPAGGLDPVAGLTTGPGAPGGGEVEPPTDPITGGAGGPGEVAGAATSVESPSELGEIVLRTMSGTATVR